VKFSGAPSAYRHSGSARCLFWSSPPNVTGVAKSAALFLESLTPGRSHSFLSFKSYPSFKAKGEHRLKEHFQTMEHSQLPPWVHLRNFETHLTVLLILGIIRSLRHRIWCLLSWYPPENMWKTLPHRNYLIRATQASRTNYFETPRM